MDLLRTSPHLAQPILLYMYSVRGQGFEVAYQTSMQAKKATDGTSFVLNTKRTVISPGPGYCKSLVDVH